MNSSSSPVLLTLALVTTALCGQIQTSSNSFSYGGVLGGRTETHASGGQTNSCAQFVSDVHSVIRRFGTEYDIAHVRGSAFAIFGGTQWFYLIAGSIEVEGNTVFSLWENVTVEWSESTYYFRQRSNWVSYNGYSYFTQWQTQTYAGLVQNVMVPGWGTLWGATIKAGIKPYGRLLSSTLDPRRSALETHGTAGLEEYAVNYGEVIDPWIGGAATGRCEYGGVGLEAGTDWAPHFRFDRTVSWNWLFRLP